MCKLGLGLRTGGSKVYPPCALLPTLVVQSSGGTASPGPVPNLSFLTLVLLIIFTTDGKMSTIPLERILF